MHALSTFDPRAFGGGSSAALSISQLTYHLSGVVRSDEILQDVWVRGEVSNLTLAASGHVYFSLKDPGACLNCVMWRTEAARLAFRPAPGMQLLAHGFVDVYAQRGQHQLIVSELQPDGSGALHLALEQAKACLIAEGLLDTLRKRPLPAFPKRIAVITSLSGAVVRDICAVARASPHPVEIVLVPAQVQGEAAVSSVCRALRLASERSGADVVILGRGGGSLEDLWTFNLEPVARAIAACRIPVISAVGHETDFTLADLAADLRAPTPSAAAEMVVSARAGQIRRRDELLARAAAALASKAGLSRLRWRGVSGHAPLLRPASIIEQRRQRVDEATGRMLRALGTCRAAWGHRVALAAGRLQGVSPLATLGRGYAAIVRLPDGAAVTRVVQIDRGSEVRVRLSDGSFDARVVGTRLDPVEE